MVNFRVRDLGALLSQLRESGVEVVREEAEEGAGRFAWIVDPEGNRVNSRSLNTAVSENQRPQRELRGLGHRCSGMRRFIKRLTEPNLVHVWTRDGSPPRDARRGSDWHDRPGSG